MADEFARAVELHRAGRHTEAESLCREVLARAVDDARALHLLGAIRFAAGGTAEGIALLRRALAAKPDYAEAEFNLAAMLAAAGRPDEAAEHYGRAAALRPGHADALARHAVTLMDLGRDHAAEAAFRRLTALRPADPLPFIDLAALTLKRGDAVAAIDYARRAVALAPGFSLAHLRLGLALAQRGDDAGAIEEYRQALALEPESLDAANCLCVALYDELYLDEAERLARHTAVRHPRAAAAAHNLAVVLLAEGHVSGALATHRQAVALAPEHVGHRRGFVSTLLYAPDISPDDRFAEHVEAGRIMAAQVPRRSTAWTNSRDPGRRLRVGWLSSDFRAHPVGRNLEPIFRHLDRSRTELVVYAERRRPDPVTAWFRNQSDAWRSTVGLSDGAVAEQIRADGIDVMIYLAGRFDHNRPQVAAWRPAPVQVSFHDPATSGLAEMDYLIADPVLVPRRTTEWFSERVVRLPHFSLQPPIPNAPPVTVPPCVAAGAPVFGSFTNPAKLASRVLQLWAALLQSAPNARLLLRYKNAFANMAVRERLAREFGPSLMARIDFDIEYRELADHLGLYGQIDVALDPFPFNGSTTTFEALWMGVPVVTLAGDTMVSRWGASMLSALGLDELVARTPDEYIEIARRLVDDPGRLSALRAGLRGRVAGSPLCDSAAFTRHFERLLRALWRRWCASP